MKTINVFLVIFLIYAIKSHLTEFGDEAKSCESYRPGGENAFSLDFCRTITYEGYSACCFVKWKNGDLRKYNCYPITSAQWGDMDVAETAFTNYANAQGFTDVDIVSFDCSSSYLYGTLLLLLAVLF